MPRLRRGCPPLAVGVGGRVAGEEDAGHQGLKDDAEARRRCVLGVLLGERLPELGARPCGLLPDVHRERLRVVLRTHPDVGGVTARVLGLDDAEQPRAVALRRAWREEGRGGGISARFSLGGRFSF